MKLIGKVIRQETSGENYELTLTVKLRPTENAPVSPADTDNDVAMTRYKGALLAYTRKWDAARGKPATKDTPAKKGGGLIGKTIMIEA